MPVAYAAVRRAASARCRFYAAAAASSDKKTLVLLGTGWGTTTILKNLDAERFSVVVVSPRNYFLFTPLLPSCTVGTTESRSIMEPIRQIVGRRGMAIRFYEAECTDIDMGRKELVLERKAETATAPAGPTDGVHTTRISYDQLVVGVGATYNTFGTPGVQQWGLFLKEMGDATKIRQRLKETIERASFGDVSEAELDRLLHVVIVGGGPTGVEFAGELHDLVAEDINRWEPGLSHRFRITLVEALPTILPSFDERLVFYTQRVLHKNGITLRTNTRVTAVTEKSIVMESTDGAVSEMPYGLLVWSAGIRAREFAHTVAAKVPDVQTSNRGLIIDNYLRVKGTTDIWAIGDCAVSKDPPLAQVASQQGKWLARALNQMARDAAVADPFRQIETRVKPFEYT
ncbi:NADH:ubiquinone oxidoreductase, partial [Coemansia spiralis]